MIDFIKQMMGITSSDEPNPNNQNYNEPRTDFDDKYWEMLEEEWSDFMEDDNLEEEVIEF